MSANLLIAMLMIAAPGSAQAPPAESFLEQEPLAPPSQGRIFGLAEATRLADARRQMSFGVCGMVIFKEKVGDVWVFQTKIGYGGIPGPDIEVIESAPDIPEFAHKIETTALTAQTRPVARRQVRSPAFGSAVSFPLRTTRLVYSSHSGFREQPFSANDIAGLRRPVEFANAKRQSMRFERCGIVSVTNDMGVGRTERKSLGYSGPKIPDQTATDQFYVPISFSDCWGTSQTPQAITARYGG